MSIIRSVGVNPPTSLCQSSDQLVSIIQTFVINHSTSWRQSFNQLMSIIRPVFVNHWTSLCHSSNLLVSIIQPLGVNHPTTWCQSSNQLVFQSTSWCQSSDQLASFIYDIFLLKLLLCSYLLSGKIFEKSNNISKCHNKLIAHLWAKELAYLLTLIFSQILCYNVI